MSPMQGDVAATQEIGQEMIWIVGVWVNIAAAGAMMATMPGASQGIMDVFYNPKFVSIPYWWKFIVTFVAVYIVALLSPVILLVAIGAVLRGDD